MSTHARKWISLIVGLLGGTVVANGLLIMAAVSDGGAQPIPNAYEKGLRWDESHPPAAAPATVPTATAPADYDEARPALAGNAAADGG